MDEDFGQKYFLLEDRHWWHSSRRDMVLGLTAGLPRSARVLDIGCSGGATLAALGRQGFTDVSGIDISASAVERCHRRGLVNVSVMDAGTLAFDEGRFDLVIASDVLEHLPDPERALLSWRRVLKDGGRLFIFVPGHAFLWSAHDVQNHHYKRYEKQDLLEALRKSGFEVKRCSGWNVGLFLPAAMMEFFRRKAGITRGATGKYAGMLHKTPFLLNALLKGWLLAENLVLRRMNSPFGVSFFAIAHKKVNVNKE